MENKLCVYYSEFGAVGDGVNEDFPSIKKCHDYANEHGLKVMADKGARYYIGDTDGVSATIRTDVDWQDATFIIDDKVISPEAKSRTAHIFNIAPDTPLRRLGADSEPVKALNAMGGIKAEEIKNIGYAPGYPALLIVHDDNSTAYLRWGVHATGRPNPQLEIIVVDADGNIDPDTPFLLDFHGVTHIEEQRVDDRPITVEGGTFITVANSAPPAYTYYSRGICISRANATVKGVVHKVTEEGPIGAPYSAFFSPLNANNVLLLDLTVQAHKMYWDYEYDKDGKVIKVHSGMGSYDIGGRLSNKVTFKNCIQSNFYKYKEKNVAFCELENWGIMGSNYCKNFCYDGCVLSRFDAHAGIYNVTIKNTTISYIKLIGGGTALIENTKVVAPEGLNAPFIELRGDYGSTWHGDIIIKDCEFINLHGKSSTYIHWKDDGVYLASVHWNNWPFGYTTYLPRFTIDNLKIDKPDPEIYIFDKMVQNMDTKIDMPVLDDGTVNDNPMRVDVTATVRNNKYGYKFVGTTNSYVNGKITVIEE